MFFSGMSDAEPRSGLSPDVVTFDSQSEAWQRLVWPISSQYNVTCDRPDTLQYSASCGPSVASPTRLSEALRVSMEPIFSPPDKWSHTRAGEMEINLQSLWPNINIP